MFISPHTFQKTIIVSAYSSDKVNNPAAMQLIAPHELSKVYNVSNLKT